MIFNIKYIFDKLIRQENIPSGIDEDLKYLIKDYLKARPGKNHNSFCNAAQTNMLFSQSGDVYVCCHNQAYSIGKYPEQSLKEIWNSKDANTFRENLKNYKLEGGCKICLDDFNRRAFTEVRARHFDTLQPHSKFPVMMEFLMSNVCNLECIMCSGNYSSLIRKNRERLPELHFPYDDSFLAQLEEFIPYLIETRFSGSGEAFSIEMNYVIWDKIIRLNPSCLIMVQTNGTILSGRVKEILEKGRFQIGISIDSLNKKTFESIRVNANFDKVMDNLLYFKDYSKRKKTRFSLSMCVMRQNWKEVPDFIRFCNDNESVATLHKVMHPYKCALFNLPKAKLKEILTFFETQIFDITSVVSKANIQHYYYFVEVVREWYQNSNEELDFSVQLSLNHNFNQLESYKKVLNELFKYIDSDKKIESEEKQNLKSKIEERLNVFLSFLTDIEYITFALDQMLITNMHYVLDVVLYHDVQKLKDDFIKNFNAHSIR